MENSRTNGNHYGIQRASPVGSSSRGTPPTSGHLTTLHTSQQHHNNHNNTHNHYLDNHNSNHSNHSYGGGPLVVDLESSSDNKRHRNGYVSPLADAPISFQLHSSLAYQRSVFSIFINSKFRQF